MKYARLVIFFIAIRLTAASNNLSQYQVGLNGGVSNSHQHEEFENKYLLRLERRGSPSRSPPPSSTTPQTGSPPARGHQPRAGSPQSAHQGDPTASQSPQSEARPSRPSRRRASPPIMNPQPSRTPAQVWRQNRPTPIQKPGPRTEPLSRQGDPLSSQNVQSVASSSRQQSPISSLPIQQPRPGAEPPEQARRRGFLPAPFFRPDSRQPVSRASSASPYISSESRSSIKPYMSGKETPASGASSSAEGGLLDNLKGLFEKANKELPEAGSPQSSSSWASSLNSLFKGSKARSTSTGGQQSSSISQLKRAPSVVGEEKARPSQSNPSLQQTENIRKGGLNAENTNSAGPSSSKPRNYSKSPASSTLYQKVMTTTPGKGNLYRSNSDPLTGPLPPARKAWGRTTKLPNKLATDPSLFISSSDFPSTPPTPQSHSSFELEQTGGSKAAASSGRSSIATSAFAQLAQGPPIVGAGLSHTTLHNELTRATSSDTLQRDSPRNGLGSYEMLSRSRDHAFNGGTASGPESLFSKALGKLGTAGEFARANPGDFSRLLGSTAGHAMIGAAPAVAATGNVPVAAVFGAAGATLSYVSGGERFIPKIEEWQKQKRLAQSLPQRRTVW